jgi:hypothetical protein
MIIQSPGAAPNHASAGTVTSEAPSAAASVVAVDANEFFSVYG